MGRSLPAYAANAFARVLCAFSLLAMCAGRVGALDGEGAPAQPLDQKEKQALVTRAGEMLAAQYVDPRRGREAQAKITAALDAGAYDGIADPAAFAQRLTDDLVAALHDKHIFVSSALVPTPPDADLAGTIPLPTYGGFARVDRLKGNIGYIRLLSFPAPAIFTPAADEAMRDVAGTDALIIDIRDNGGGSLESESYFASFFFDPQKPVRLNSVIQRAPGTFQFTWRWFWTRPVELPCPNTPVYILTSAQTFSAAEAFAYDLKAHGRAAIYGQTTGGAANPGEGRLLGSGFGIYIPTGHIVNPLTGTSWEGAGVAPDMPVDDKRAFQAAMRDILSRRAGLAAVKEKLALEPDVDPFVETHLLKVRTTPLPGSEAAIRRNIEDLARGTPNYRLMSKALAGTTRLQLPRLQHELDMLGPIKSVRFQYVGSQGLDVFDVTMANGLLQYGIFVEPDGKIETGWIRPLPRAAPDQVASGGAAAADKAQAGPPP